MTATRRDEILRAAAELFADRGFHAVGMRAIADAVGIRGSSLYHHFPSKVELLHAIAVESTKRFVEQALADLGPSPSYSQRLFALLRDHVLYFHEYRLEEAVGLRELQELRNQAPEHYAELQAIRRDYQSAVESLVVGGCEAGEFDCAEPHLATLALLGMINSVNDWFRSDRQATIENVAETFASFAVHRVLGGQPEG